jgi:ribonuclease HI
MLMQNEWWIVTDGACSGNPGPGGYGLILRSPADRVTEAGGAEVHTTNNRMELLALIDGLERVEKEIEDGGRIHFVTDSSYVLNGTLKFLPAWRKRDFVTTEGKPVANREMWERMARILDLLRERAVVIRSTLVPGHAAIEINERADVIAVTFRDRRSLGLFSGNIKDYPVSFSLRPFGALYLSFVDGQLMRHATWDACQKATHGKKGAKFKKVASKNEELETLRSWGCIID